MFLMKLEERKGSLEFHSSIRLIVMDWISPLFPNFFPLTIFLLDLELLPRKNVKKNKIINISPTHSLPKYDLMCVFKIRPTFENLKGQSLIDRINWGWKEYTQEYILLRIYIYHRTNLMQFTLATTVTNLQRNFETVRI